MMIYCKIYSYVRDDAVGSNFFLLMSLMMKAWTIGCSFGGLYFNQYTDNNVKTARMNDFSTIRLSNYLIDKEINPKYCNSTWNQLTYGRSTCLRPGPYHEMTSSWNSTYHGRLTSRLKKTGLKANSMMKQTVIHIRQHDTIENETMWGESFECYDRTLSALIKITNVTKCLILSHKPLVLKKDSTPNLISCNQSINSRLEEDFYNILNSRYIIIGPSTYPLLPSLITDASVFRINSKVKDIPGSTDVRC